MSKSGALSHGLDTELRLDQKAGLKKHFHQHASRVEITHCGPGRGNEHRWAGWKIYSHQLASGAEIA